MTKRPVHRPWTKFQRWARKQPANRIAGKCLNFDTDKIPRHCGTDNVIGAYLCVVGRATNKHELKGGPYLVTLPRWCVLLLKQIEMLSQGKKYYQYRTVWKAMQIVSKELRGQN